MYFMMLPLWTKLMFLRLFVSDHWIAARTSRSVPSTETGFKPMERCWESESWQILLEKLSLSKRFEFGVGFGAVGKFDTGVNIFGVLAENHHVDMLRMLHRRRHAVEILHRTLADVEIEQLAQTDVERRHAAANGRRQRPFDTDEKFRERGHGLFMQPAIVLLEGFLTGVHFHPADFLFALVSFFHCRVEDAHGCTPDIAARAVAFDKGNNRIVGNLQLFVGSHGDLRPVLRDFYDFVLCHSLLICKNSLRTF